MIALQLVRRMRRIAVAPAVTLVAFVTVYAVARWSPYPQLEAFLRRPYSVAVTDRHGTVLQVLPVEDGLRREFTPLEQLPQELVEVFVTAEDRRFRRHPGVDPLALARASRV